MSRFRGTLRAVRARSTEVSRLSDRGMVARLNGWKAGIEVELYVDDTGNDCARVCLTGGSSDNRATRVLFSAVLTAP